MSQRSLEIASDKLIRISYSAMISIGIAVFGFAIWMASVEGKAQANATNLDVVRNKQDANIEILKKIDNRLTRIETLLERILTK